MRKAGHFFSVLLCISLMGCGMSAEEFVKEIEHPKNGLRVEKKTTKYRYSLQYCPYDYMYIQALRGKKPEKTDFEKREKDLEGLVYLILSVENMSKDKNLGRTSESFGSIYDYFSSYFEYVVALDCGERQLPCSLFHTEGLYGVESDIKIHLGFENVCEGHDLTLRFLNELDSTEPIEITIKNEDIKNRPEYTF